MIPGAISAVLLAAGESRRMGAINKLTLPVDGRALVRRMAGTLVDARLQEVVVVLGHEAQQLQSLLLDLPLTVVVNEHYHDGPMSSVHAGLAALTHACDGVMIALADQPLIETADINHIIDAYVARPRGSVLVPTYHGSRGNPIILSWEHRSAILAGHRNLGCKHFIEKNPSLVTTFEMDTDHVVFDLDTPADLATLQTRLHAAHIWPSGVHP
jgi:molybdenum cofactor cytidylyltransferase